MKTLASLIAIVTVATQSLFSGVDLGIELQFAIGTRIESHEHIVQSRKGPPPWAPAHGHRAKGKFHYYPTHQVYRNANTGAWIFYRDGSWQVGVNLPNTIRIGTDSKFVSLEMNSELPYHHHEEMVRTYPASIARVTVSHFEQNSSHPGRGHGNSKGNPGKGKGKKK